MEELHGRSMGEASDVLDGMRVGSTGPAALGALGCETSAMDGEGGNGLRTLGEDWSLEETRGCIGVAASRSKTDVMCAEATGTAAEAARTQAGNGGEGKLGR